jgi:RES domain-containing protein
LRFAGRCYRGHDPAWSFTPISGDGAALTGGRFNRKGEPTLYLSLDVMTAIVECTHGFAHRLLPLTMCEYDVDCEPVADLRDAAGRASFGVDLADLSCPWLDHQLAGREAASWRVADRLRGDGYCGMLVPSFAVGATDANRNLVLWTWGANLPQQVTVYDPSGRLPRNQLSWPDADAEGTGP